MVWKHILKTSLTGLATNRSRSLLTILGIVIGITAIMMVISLGAGAQGLILGQVQGLGSQTMEVHAGREPKGPSDIATIFSDSLKAKDLPALQNKANVPGLKNIMPGVFGASSAAYGSNTYQITFFGGTELMTDVLDVHIDRGRFIDASEVPSRSDVVVIGSKVAEHLFDNDDPLNKSIKIKGRNFKVIGVLAKTGGGTFFNFDDMVLMPYTSAQDYLLGIKYFNNIIIQAADGADVNIVADDVRLTLRESHGITDSSKDDFYVRTQADIANRLSTITDVLTYFLVAVASIALFVGGVGIMNIMLVAVTERTREIGLRKAVGATDRDILSQFLLEAVLLTSIGGLIGVALGSIFAFATSIGLSRGLGLNWPFFFPWKGALLGIGVSTLVGLIFGGYPARQASLKNPIEALRYE